MLAVMPSINTASCKGQNIIRRANAEEKPNKASFLNESLLKKTGYKTKGISLAETDKAIAIPVAKERCVL